MARFSIEIPEDLRNRAEARASESGHSSVEQYLQSLLRADLERAHSENGLRMSAPDHLTVGTRAELEAKILEGLATPVGEMGPGDWDELRRKVNERRAR